MKILLIGNPNVGKSVLFNRLTGAVVTSSNYHGTTVEITKGHTRIQGEKVEVIDIPGIYSLKASSKAEEIACEIIDKSDKEDIFINVLDATNLERSLNLTLQVLKLKRPTISVLNFWDETKHTGIKINLAKFENILGVPCIPTVAVRGEGIKQLVEKISQSKVSTYNYEETNRWSCIGNIVEAVQKVTRRHHTFLENLGDASVKPFPGLLIALAVIITAFELIRQIGEGLIGYVFEPLFETFWTPLILKLSAFMGHESFIHELLIGKITAGKIEYMESFGLLTTGIFVPIGAILPYVFAFYLVLSLLEDSGYLPRLAVLVDVIMHKVGLHGMAIIPMILGLGCNVPGGLATRIIENKREKFIAATLMAISVPCMAQIAMIIGLSGEYGMRALVPIFGTLFITGMVIGYILKKVLKGESPEIIIDIPPYRIPYFEGICKKVSMRLIHFIKEAVPWVCIGVLFTNILYLLHIINFVGNLAAPVINGILGLPKEAVGALIVGFLRKDVAVGMLKPLNMDLRQIVVSSIVLAMYFPCMATFVVLIKELGIIDMIKSAIIMIVSTIIVGGLVNFIFYLL